VLYGLYLSAQNEPGLQSPDSTTTVKKDIHSSRKIVVGLNTKRLALPLADNRKTITFTDKKGIGRLKLKGTRDLHFYSLGKIKR
jgi:putative transposase